MKSTNRIVCRKVLSGTLPTSINKTRGSNCLTYEIAGVEREQKDEKGGHDMEMFVLYLERLVDFHGVRKYPSITCLFKVLLSISHGNSAPENGFSIKKHLLSIHGFSTKEDTIEALRIVKDAILHYPSILSIPITRDLLTSVKHSRQRYMADLEEKRKIKEKEAAKQKEKVCDVKSNEKSEELEKIKVTLAQIHNGFMIADESVSEGNAKLKELLLKKSSTRN